MNKLRLFSSQISPSCSYCKFGMISRSGESVLCEKCGVSKPEEYCKKFYYAPLKRIPKRKPQLQNFDSSDFEL